MMRWYGKARLFVCKTPACTVIGLNGEGRFVMNMSYATNRKMASVHRTMTDKISKGDKRVFQYPQRSWVRERKMYFGSRMGVFSYLTGSAKKLRSHVSDTNVRLPCIIPAKIHAPLPHPPSYNSNMLFKLSPVTWREITERVFQKDLKSSDLKLTYSWKWNLGSQGFECFKLLCLCKSIPQFGLHYFLLSSPAFCYVLWIFFQAPVLHASPQHSSSVFVHA